MHRAKGCGVTEHDDQPFDLAPATIMQMVANVSAFHCPFGSFDTRCHAKLIHQNLRFRHILRFDIKRQIHEMQDFRYVQIADGPGGVGSVCDPVIQSVYAISVKACG